MDWYPRYYGDYAKDTAHLSLIEHGAYTLLMDACYGRAMALANDMPSLYRICRAMSEQEQQAVQSVVKTFFILQDDGLLHNARIDKELDKINTRSKRCSEAAHKRFDGNAKAMPRQCDGNAIGDTSTSTSTYKDKSIVERPSDNTVITPLSDVSTSLSPVSTLLAPVSTPLAMLAKAEAYAEADKDKSIVCQPTRNEDFERVWSLYPDKSDKQKAELAFNRWRKKGDTVEEMLVGLERYKVYVAQKRAKGFPDLKYKIGKTWFNGRCWKDEYRIDENAAPRKVSVI